MVSDTRGGMCMRPGIIQACRILRSLTNMSAQEALLFLLSEKQSSLHRRQPKSPVLGWLPGGMREEHAISTHWHTASVKNCQYLCSRRKASESIYSEAPIFLKVTVLLTAPPLTPLVFGCTLASFLFPKHRGVFSCIIFCLCDPNDNKNIEMMA